MFHWICPECGREIAPTAKECPACEPATVTPAPAAVISAPEAVTATMASPAPPEMTAPEAEPARILTPVELPREMEIVAPAASRALPTPFPEQPVLLAAPKAPAALLAPAAIVEPSRELEPEPQLQATLPLPSVQGAVKKGVVETRRQAPTIVSASPVEALPAGIVLPVSTTTHAGLTMRAATHVPNAGLREPQPQSLQAGIADFHVNPAEPFAPQLLPCIPLPGVRDAAPAWAPVQRCARISVASIHPAPGNRERAGSPPQAHISIPGPVLPYELTSLHAAGLDRMLPFHTPAAVPPRRNGMFVSAAVASGLLAAALGGVFYAMPTLAEPSSANSKPAPQPVAEVPAPAPARTKPAELEVTGIRFVTDLPDRGPQIHYLVVNHSNGPLNGVVVNVTLRAAGSQPPLSQFSFRTPRLGPYESREMISAIERMNRALETPDWRDVEAEIELTK